MPEASETFRIQRLGAQGDGIAETADGAPLYAARMLPGEQVTGRLEGDRLHDIRIVEPAAERVRPPCAHYARCGGCTVQHADDAFVARWKQQIVETALAAQGLHGPFRPIVTSPPFARRRAVLSGRRLKKGSLIGFHTRASDTIVAVPDCQVLDPRLRAAIPALEALMPILASRSAELAFALTATESGLDVDARGGKTPGPPEIAELAEIVQRFGLARLALDGEPVATSRPPLVRFDGIAVSPPPGAFLQATPQGETALRDAVTEAVGSAKHIADLFAGCGTFSLPLARQAEVHAAEDDAALLSALDQGWRQATGLRRVTTEVRDLFRRPLLAAELARFDAVVIDPPRAGAAAQTAELASARVPVIAAVSCNPVSLARDLRALCDAGYRLDWLQVVDQFRWSHHVEIAARLSLPHTAD